jgi:hypothetical protein
MDMNNIHYRNYVFDITNLNNEITINCCNKDTNTYYNEIFTEHNVYRLTTLNDIHKLYESIMYSFEHYTFILFMDKNDVLINMLHINDKITFNFTIKLPFMKNSTEQHKPI